MSITLNIATKPHGTRPVRDHAGAGVCPHGRRMATLDRQRLLSLRPVIAGPGVRFP